ncbi:MAG: tetratricopeptide repeat protein [Miltoncostaeaceae bacterium]
MSIDRIAYFGDLVAEQPDEPRARYGLAVALRQAERWDEAVDQYRAYLALASDEGAAWGHLAECLAATGNTDAAADAYTHAAIDAALANGHTGLADDFQQALEALA